VSTIGFLYRIGHGYDVHRLKEGRRLVIGGVKLEYERGLDGHSDADVLVHAVMDAVIGALGEGDIGRLFPDSDDEHLDADSLALAGQVAALMRERGYEIVNIDATVVAQAPRLAPHVARMCENIARAFGCPAGAVNVKATTEERLGFTGEGLGIAAHAVALLAGRSA
jgi:2-C-methyl-D-erythritol 2,4-cyclodiphosphate synthase